MRELLAALALLLLATHVRCSGADRKAKQSVSAMATGPARQFLPILRDRRVEITRPTDRKMVINALNSGAKMFMGDFEDAKSPTWHNMIEGHLAASNIFSPRSIDKQPRSNPSGTGRLL